MRRRNFIKLSTLAATALTSSTLNNASLNASSRVASNDTIKAKCLNSGDTVGVISPATSVSDPDDLYVAKEALDFFGLKMKIGKNVIKGTGYKSRTEKERLEDLTDMFTDKSVNAIFCIRGGYGSPGLLDKIDYEVIKQNPKIFLGYSDITALHLAINKKTGLVSFHGPMLLSSFSAFTIDNFKKALFQKEPIGIIKNPETKRDFRTVHPVRTIFPGKAIGKLIGGNLTLITSLIGTDFEIETKGKILFLEDVGEEPYRIDRMLTQLNLSGKLKDCGGVVFGNCEGCDYNGLKPSRIWDDSLGEILNKQLGNLGIPVFFGLTIGHSSDQLTIPIGVNAEIDADECYLNILESALI